MAGQNSRKSKEANLSSFLNRLHARYNKKQYLSSDPLEFAHLYEDPWDQEVVALLAAVLAYGNVKQIRRSIEGVLERIRETGKSPSQFVRSLDQVDFLNSAQQSFESFVHRFNRGQDIILLFCLLNRSWKTYGSLGSHFLQFLAQDDLTIESALTQFIADWLSWIASGDPNWIQLSSFSYLLTSPADGSCCKRWCMFLRWMTRNDGLDLGLWVKQGPLSKTFPKGRKLNTAHLVIPLDTHTGRISQYLGLTQRKSMNWLAALEVTASLRKCDPTDPVRYDFSLSRLGILALCKKEFRREICQNCELLDVCTYAKDSISKMASSKHVVIKVSK